MPNLSIRNLDPKAYRQLQQRAVTHGVSMEEEVRQIIYKAIDTPDKITDVFKKHFGVNKGIDLTQPDRAKPHNPMDFDE